MARAPRIEFAGAIYHVMNRGDHFERIFGDEKDREVFLRVLDEVARASGWAVHGFVLMPNHYHLLVETPRPNLVRGMQQLNSTYTLRYNGRHQLRGHLFQGRYKALLVDGEGRGYFLQVSDYIHLNPVRARLATESGVFWRDPWSSAGFLSGMRKGRPEWLRWERVYGELGLKDWGRRARREYRGYLERRMAETLSEGRKEAAARWGKIRRGWCLGGEHFMEEMKRRLVKMCDGSRKRESWNGAAVDEMEEQVAGRWLTAGMKKLGHATVASLSKRERYLLARWVRQNARIDMSWLAEALEMPSAGALSFGVWYARRQIDSQSAWEKQWKTLIH